MRLLDFIEEDHRLVLADHALVQHVFEAQKFVLFAFNEARNRHAAPFRNDLGGLFLGNLFLELRRLLAPFLFKALQLVFHLRDLSVRVGRKRASVEAAVIGAPEWSW